MWSETRGTTTGDRIVMALLAASAALAVPPAALAETATDAASVKVTTSRGDLDLRLYRPLPSGQVAPPGAAPTIRKPIILLLSGEGGWRRFDVLLAETLRSDGYWVGGVDCMSYFWKPQDDRSQLASDIRAFAASLAQAAGAADDAPLVLAGYSFGADLAPWLAGAEGWPKRVSGMVMIGPDEIGSLEFRVLEMLGVSMKSHVFRVADALRDAAGIPVLFIHGGGDRSSAAPSLSLGASEPKRLSVVDGADHHFTGREEPFKSALLDGMRWMIEAAPRPAAPSRGAGR